MCGTRFTDEAAAEPAPPVPAPSDLLSLFMPFIALIVALVMRSGEVRPSRRGFLKTRAIASGAWLGVSSSTAGCKGGIDRLTSPSLVSSDNKYWTAIYACVGGGTTSKPWHGRVP